MKRETPHRTRVFASKSKRGARGIRNDPIRTADESVLAGRRVQRGRHQKREKPLPRFACSAVFCMRNLQIYRGIAHIEGRGKRLSGEKSARYAQRKEERGGGHM